MRNQSVLNALLAMGAGMKPPMAPSGEVTGIAPPSKIGIMPRYEPGQPVPWEGPVANPIPDKPVPGEPFPGVEFSPPLVTPPAPAGINQGASPMRRPQSRLSPLRQALLRNVRL